VIHIEDLFKDNRYFIKSYEVLPSCIPLWENGVSIDNLAQKGCLINQALFYSLKNDRYKDPGAWKRSPNNVSIYLLPLYDR